MSMFIGVIIFSLGGFLGFSIKLGFDYYHDFIIKQEISLENLNKINAKWELIEEERQKSIKS